MNKMAVRAKNRKNFGQHLLLGPWPVFQNDFTEMFLGWPFTRIVKMVLLCWTKWPSELKIEKTPLNDMSSLAHGAFSKFHTNVFCMTFTRIAKLVTFCWTKCLPELKIEQCFKQHPIQGCWAVFLNYFIEMFLEWPFTKTSKMVLLRWKGCQS